MIKRSLSVKLRLQLTSAIGRHAKEGGDSGAPIRVVVGIHLVGTVVSVSFQCFRAFLLASKPFSTRKSKGYGAEQRANKFLWLKFMRRTPRSVAQSPLLLSEPPSLRDSDSDGDSGSEEHYKELFHSPLFAQTKTRSFGFVLLMRLVPDAAKAIERGLTLGVHSCLFVVVTLLFAYFYDNLASAVISRVYKTDKYGVVINYAVIVLLQLLVEAPNNISALIRKKLKERHKTGKVLVEARKRLKLWRNVNVVFAILKIFLFNLIFKNHTGNFPLETDADRIHGILHVVCVILLGLACLAHNLVRLGAVPRIFLSRFGQVLALGAAFMLAQTYAEAVSEKSAMRNLLSVTLEAVLIASTV